MSKYYGPRFRIVRRLGELPALTRKVPKRTVRPGQHGKNRRKLTRFAYRLIEKQKLRFYYGISEKQLVNYVKASRNEKGPTGQILLQTIEIRLDNIIFRLCWSPTILAARQYLNHKYIFVDKKCVTFPSFSCSSPQIITVGRKRNIRKIVHDNVQECSRSLPSHLSIDSNNLTAVVNQLANCHEIVLKLNELLVIEYYSKRL